METIFVVTQQPFPWSPNSIGFLVYAIVTLAIPFCFFIENKTIRRNTFVGLGLWALAACIPTALYVRDRTAFFNVVREYAKSDYQIAEGTIHNYTVSNDQFTDSFDLGNEHFQISSLYDKPGFNQTRARGGQYLQDGVQTRIYHHGNVILRIDISR